MTLEYRPDHLHLRSADPEAAARFYVEVLNGREIGRAQGPGGLRMMVELAGHLLFIEQVPADTAFPPEPVYQGLEHLGLRVDDLDAAEQDLARHGVRFLEPPKQPRPDVRFAFIEGPDRVRIEILQRSKV